MSVRCSSKQIQYGIRRSTLQETGSRVYEILANKSKQNKKKNHVPMYSFSGIQCLCVHLGMNARVCVCVFERLRVFTLQSGSLPRTSRACSPRKSPSFYCAVPSGLSAPQARWTARGSWSWSCPRRSGPPGLTCPDGEGGQRESRRVRKPKLGMKQQWRNWKVLVRLHCCLFSSSFNPD